MAHSFGLILANRAVVLGAIQARDLIDLTVDAERSGTFDAVWVGDSLLAKPRLESVTLLSAPAGGRTGSGEGRPMTACSAAWAAFASLGPPRHTASQARPPDRTSRLAHW